MSTTYDIPGSRERTYRALERRNRVVAVLRLAVPTTGLLVFAALVAHIIIANTGIELAAGGIRMAEDSLLIDTPSYSGITNTGTRYTITAAEASTPADKTDLVDLTTTDLTTLRPDGYQLQANAAAARFSFSMQKVWVDSLMQVVDSRGITAWLHNSVIDWTQQTLDTKGHVHIVFADGSVLDSKSLYYNAVQATWDFRSVTLTLAPEKDPIR